MDSPIDLNNNAEEKIYSLRPRSSIRNNREHDNEEESTWKPRSRAKKRTKQKSAPLSKYRRKTANARERSRMREINEAFEALRRAVPHLKSNSENPAEKISKIMTLRLAMKYITALNNALQEPHFGEVSLNDIVLSYDGMLTPSGSLSEHSEFGDEVFVSTVPSESLSSSPPIYDVPGLITPPLSEIVHLPSFNNFRSEPLVSPLTSSVVPIHQPPLLPSETGRSSRTVAQGFPQSMVSPSSGCHLLTPIEDVSQSDISYHSKQISSSSSNFTLTTSFLSTDFDGLPSPAMDFDDLFIK